VGYFARSTRPALTSLALLAVLGTLGLSGCGGSVVGATDDGGAAGTDGDASADAPGHLRMRDSLDSRKGFIQLGVRPHRSAEVLLYYVPD
jgi:hypothetical protein